MSVIRRKRSTVGKTVLPRNMLAILLRPGIFKESISHALLLRPGIFKESTSHVSYTAKAWNFQGVYIAC